MNWVVYSLLCPLTSEVRYVGFTSVGIKTRLKGHLNEGRLALKRPVADQTYRQRWLISLLAAGLTPTAVILEKGSGPGWQECERKWIAYFRSAGKQLVNCTDGGDGKPGCKSQKTPEERSAIARKAWDGATPEQREQWRKKIAEIGRKSQLSRTKEERSETGKKTQAKIPPEIRSAKVKKGHAGKSPEALRVQMKRISMKGVAARWWRVDERQESLF